MRKTPLKVPSGELLTFHADGEIEFEHVAQPAASKLSTNKEESREAIGFLDWCEKSSIPVPEPIFKGDMVSGYKWKPASEHYLHMKYRWW